MTRLLQLLKKGSLVLFPFKNLSTFINTDGDTIDYMPIKTMIISIFLQVVYLLI